MSEELFIYAKTGVFWDVVDCPAPKGLNPESIYENIKSGLRNMGYRGQFSEFWAYASKVSEDMFYDYNAVGIAMERVKGDQYVRADLIAQDILLFALDTRCEPANLMLITDNMSQKPELVRVLQALKSRNINIVVAQTDTIVPLELHGVASCVCLSKRLLARGKATTLELAPENKNVINPDILHSLSNKLPFDGKGTTGVFWDTEDCPNPDALESDFYLIGKNIRSVLASKRRFCGRVSLISSYGDRRKRTVWNGGTDTKTDLYQGGRWKRMLLDILLWAVNNSLGRNIDYGPNVMVISKNIPKTRTFITTLKQLSLRDFHIFLGVPDDKVDDEVKSVNPWTKVTVVNLGVPFFSSGSSQTREEYTQKPVAGPNTAVVLWDLVDCPIPWGLDLDPNLIFANIKSVLGNMGGGYELKKIWAYTGKVTETMSNDYDAAGIKMELLDFPSSDLSARVRAMQQDMTYLARRNYVNLIVIGKDILEDGEFIGHLGFLKSDLHCNVMISSSLLDGEKAVLSVFGENKNVNNNSVEALSEELALADTGIVPELDNSVEATVARELAYANTGVYWDIEDCPIPEGLNANQINANIKSALGIMGYHGTLTDRWAYAREISKDIFYSGIFMQAGQEESARVYKMTRAILLFALDNPYEPSNLMVIANNMSQKPKLIRVLKVLKSRNINVVVAQHDTVVPVELHGIVSSVCLSENLLARGKATLLELEPENKNVINLNFLHNSAMSKEPAYGKTGVFWDTKDCSNLNLESDFWSVLNNIKSGLAAKEKSGSCVSSISSYDDVGNITVWEGGLCTGILLHQGDQLKRMSLDILLWTLENRVGQFPNSRREPNVIVVSINKSKGFVTTMKYLSARHCNVIFAEANEINEIVGFTSLY